jgi:hypothetical protein
MKRYLHYNVLNYVFLRTLVYRGKARKLFWGGLKVLSKNRRYKIILFNKDRVWLQTSM